MNKKTNYTNLKPLNKKAVNIYINEDIQILEQIYYDTFNFKPNRSKIYAAFLKQTLESKGINTNAVVQAKNICNCCGYDASIVKTNIYLCHNNEKKCSFICGQCAK